MREGIKRGSGALKRKREDGEGEEVQLEKKKKRMGGPKAPNPLSVKKSKKKVEGDTAPKDEAFGGQVQSKVAKAPTNKGDKEWGEYNSNPGQAGGSEAGAKRKRKRKHKSAESGGVADTEVADD